MPIFGQVWLWSSLAFLLGAVLCWGLVALPARRRVNELEAELDERASRPLSVRREEPRRAVEDDLAPVARDEVENEPLTRAYALSGMRGTREGGVSAPPETADEGSASATQYLNRSGSSSAGSLSGSPLSGSPAGSSAGSAGLASSLQAPPEVPPQDPDGGWFDDQRAAERERGGEASETTVLPPVRAEEPVDRRLVDDDVAGPEDGGTVFTQRTHPIPGELIRQLDDSAAEPGDQLAPELADALVDDLEDEPESAAEQTILAEPVSSGESKHQLAEDAAVTSTMTPTTEPASESRGTETGAEHGAHDRTEVVPARTPEGRTEGVFASEHSTPGAEEPKNMPGVTVQAEPTQSKLPKRVPSKPPKRTPFGVQTTSPASQPLATEAAATGAEDAPRSLFEPIVPAGEGPKVPPPPHRLRGEGKGHGPFGPGSAMPLPGGAAPGPEYTIKASVSALRYCSPDSEKFERTVAEVWFRSAEDAERVGFRPVG